MSKRSARPFRRGFTGGVSSGLRSGLSRGFLGSLLNGPSNGTVHGPSTGLARGLTAAVLMAAVAASALVADAGHAQSGARPAGRGDTSKDTRKADRAPWDGWRFGVVHGGRRTAETPDSKRPAAGEAGRNGSTDRRSAQAGRAAGATGGSGGASGASGSAAPAQSAASGSRVTTGTVKDGFRLLYDEAPGLGFQKPVANAMKYAIVYQDDADQGARSGRIDPVKVAVRVRAIFDEGGASPWGVLDFEEPYDDIFHAGPSDPRYAPAIESLIATIRHVKQQFPQTKWTYYAFPRIPYWIGTGSDTQWVQVDAVRRREEFDRALAPYAPLMNELDWFMPSVYDVYERALNMPISPVSPTAAEADYRRASVEVIRHWFAQQNATCPPIIPVVSPWFQPGGRALRNRAIPSAEFVEDQVRPLAEAGVAGISIWSGLDWFIDISTRENMHLSAAGRTAREEMRGIFAAEYFGTTPDAVDWSSPATRRVLVDACNATLRQAMLSIAQAGESARQAPPPPSRDGSGSVVANGEIDSKPGSRE